MCVSFATPSLVAQRAPGSVAGTVIDSDGRVIPDVEVIVVDTKTSIRSDSVGKFFLAALDAGDRELRVRRLAYAPVTVIVQVEPKDTIDVTITLTVVAQKLNAVLVHEDVTHVRLMRQFEERRKRGFGHFITRREIEDRHPLLLSDMMRRVPGTMLTPAAGGRSVLRFSRALIGGTRDCPPQYWLDGVMVYGFNIDDIMPSDIEGIELYSGASVVPPEFNNPRSTVACGLVVIWTRVP
jgi:hypothetical protein